MRSSKIFSSSSFHGSTLAPHPAFCAIYTWERLKRSCDISSAHTLEWGSVGKLQTLGPAKLIERGTSTCENVSLCFYNAFKKYDMNIQKYALKGMNLKFGRKEGRETCRMEERKRQPTLSQDVTLRTSFSSPESTEC